MMITPWKSQFAVKTGCPTSGSEEWRAGPLPREEGKKGGKGFGLCLGAKLGGMVVG